MLTSISQILTPVALCSLYVILLVRLLEWDLRVVPNLFERTWYKLGVQDSSDSMSRSLIMVGVFVTLIALVTLFVLFAFYMRCYGCLKQYFRLPSIIIMTLITPAYLRTWLATVNWFSLDMITLVLFTWNFAAFGCIAIFGIYASAPLVLQQLYLIHNSAMLALLMITALPGWAPWILLGILVFWDLFAVLAPFGPLNLILRIADREGITDMPGLIYSTSASQKKLGRPRDGNTDTPGDQQRAQQNPRGDLAAEQVTVRTPLDISETRVDTVDSTLEEAHTISHKSIPVNALDDLRAGFEGARTIAGRNGLDSHDQTLSGVSDMNGGSRVSQLSFRDEPAKARLGAADETHPSEGLEAASSSQEGPFEDQGVSMGLGDFIFYGLLVGLTCRGRDRDDYYATLAVLESIFMGLVATLLILVLQKRAIPALPISLSLGLLVAPLAMQFAPMLSNSLASDQIFI